MSSTTPLEDDTTVEPEKFPFPLYAWVIEAEEGKLYAVPAFVVQEQGGQPQAKSMVYLNRDMALAEKELAQNVANQVKKKLKLVWVQLPDVLETLEPQHILHPSAVPMIQSR